MIKTVDAMNIFNTLEMNRVEHTVLTKYFIQQNLQEKLLNIYQQMHDCIVCYPMDGDFGKLHCVVRYSDDEKFTRLLNEHDSLKKTLSELS